MEIERSVRMREKSRRYDAEFKREAIRLVIEGGRTAVAIARDLGIEVERLQRWNREFLADPDNSFPGKGPLKPADEELWAA